MQASQISWALNIGQRRNGCANGDWRSAVDRIPTVAIEPNIVHAARLSACGGVVS